MEIHTLVLITDSVEVPWTMWLPNLSHIRKLSISCPRSEGVLRALLATSPEDGLPFCPSLNSLAIYRCGKHALVDHVGLMKFVLYRYRVERPLRKLMLHQDDWEWIQQLNESWSFLTEYQCKHFGSPTTHCLLIIRQPTSGTRYTSRSLLISTFGSCVIGSTCPEGHPG